MQDLTTKGYEVIEEIGSGGFGVVYRAHQSSAFNREVAIKVIRPQFANVPDYIRRFEREAQIISRLQHPHIVPLIDYWRDPDGAYLVMGWLRGGNLNAMIESDPIDIETTGNILNQICSGLEAAHQSGVIHRDIKPSNVLLDEYGNARVADFGIAKDLMLTSREVTEADAVVGSPGYLSPEQARGEIVTPRTDVYSLGVMLYEMLAGEHPFAGSHAVDKMYKHLNEPLPFLDTLDSNVKDTINDVIQMATAKNPAERYATAIDFVTAYREAAKLGFATAQSVVESLTRREQEILQLIIDGKSNKEIAAELFIAVGTVRWHIRQIYGKLNVRSRVQAIVKARELELIVSDGNGKTAAQVDSTYFLMPEPENPYKGLNAFTSADSSHFFGRDALINKLLTRLEEDVQHKRFMAVLGPSGSGKSSLVKAGLIPAIWRGKDLPGSDNWYVVEMLPGAYPLDELEVALTRVAADQGQNLMEHLERDARGLVRIGQLILPDDDSELLIVIDQFEEVFTLVEDEARRSHFLDLIYMAVTDPRSRVRIVITLRADFYDRPLQYPQFGEMLRNRMETILPLSADELEAAIVQPARKVGVKFADGLVSTIVANVKYQPGALPLMQYALTELFEQRDGRVITHETYQAVGGTTGAIARRADSLFEEMNEEGQAAARQIFLRLVTLGEGTEDTRRRVERSELLAIADDTDLINDIIDTYAGYRLLALDHDPASRAPTVEVAHEAILREWDRLRDWLNGSRDDIKLQRQLADAARRWTEGNRDSGHLLHGAPLREFERWQETTQLALTPLEIEFLEASIGERERREAKEKAQAEREASLQARARKILQGLVAVFVMATIIASGSSIYALNERDRANAALDDTETARDEARQNAIYGSSLALAAAANSAQLLNNSDQAIALAVAANSITDAPPAYAQSVLYDIAFKPATRRVVNVTKNFPIISFINPSGQRVLTFEMRQKSAIYWDLMTGQPLAQWTPDFLKGNEICETANGSIFVPGTETAYIPVRNPSSTAGAIIEFDLTTGQEIRRFTPPEGFPCDMVFNPATQILISEVVTGPWTIDTVLGLNTWDITTGQLTRYAPLQLNELPTDVGHLDCTLLTTDGESFVTSHSTGLIAVWDTVTGELMRTYGEMGAANRDVHTCAYVTPAGIVAHSLDAATLNTTATLWDETSGKQLQQSTWDARRSGFALSPDGRKLALSFESGQIAILDLDTWQETNLFGQAPPGGAVVFTPDSHYLLSSGGDGGLRLWNLENVAEIRRIEGLENILGAFVISPDGQTAAAQEHSGMIERGQLGLLDLGTGELIRSLAYNQFGVRNIAFSPDGSNIVSGSNRGYAACRSPGSTLHLTDVATGDMIWEVTKEVGNTYGGLTFTQDGRWVLTVDWRCEDFVTVWDATTGAKLDEWHGHEDSIRAIDASPDGKWIATGSQDRTAIVWDATTGGVIQTLPHETLVTAVAFSPDSQFLLTFGTKLRLWDVTTGHEIRHFVRYTSSVYFVDFSPDGRYVVSSGADDGNIFVWEVQTGDAVRYFHTPLLVPVGSVVAFSPDGQSIYFTDENNIIHNVDLMLEPGELMEWIQENRYVRDLTADECTLYRIEAYCEAGGNSRVMAEGD